MAKREAGCALTQLGRPAGIPKSPAEARLDTVANPHPNADYVVRFTAPEFTCLCPVTGQPDFAHFVIDYVPGKSIVESKSLKLFSPASATTPAFHEDCTLDDRQAHRRGDQAEILRIAGYWYPRGGIPIDVFWQTGKLPAGMSGFPTRAFRPIAGGAELDRSKGEGGWPRTSAQSATSTAPSSSGRQMFFVAMRRALAAASMSRPRAWTRSACLRRPASPILTSTGSGNETSAMSRPAPDASP